MKPAVQVLARTGCLVSVVAPIVGAVLYPRANWLFLLVLLGIAIVLFDILTHKDPTPQEVAERAEALLQGTYGKYDVDNYEHLNPKDPSLMDLWRRTLELGGLPEKWVRLSEEKKNQLRAIIQELRQTKISKV
jgi:hypothetical protein